MSTTNFLQRMLPDIGQQQASILQAFGDTRSEGPHGGLGIAYPDAQLNASHPSVHSPISGHIEYQTIDLQTGWNVVSIRDAAGFLHRFYHMSSHPYPNGEFIAAGQVIGVMDGLGAYGQARYTPHLHYEIHDSMGRRHDPQTWWQESLPGQPGSAQGASGSGDLMGAANTLGLGFIQAASSAAHGMREASYGPLAIDLNADFFQLSEQVIPFDTQGNGSKNAHIPWIAGDNAWLVQDRNLDGQISQASEMYGLHPINSPYANLRLLDSNHDAKLDSQDPEFATLQLWQDQNQDGITQAGELFGLSSRVSSLAFHDPNGNLMVGAQHHTNGLHGAKLHNGSEVMMTQIGINAIENSAAHGNFYRIEQTSPSLANTLQGSGWVPDLAQARQQSTELNLLYMQFLQHPSAQVQQHELDQLLQSWANTATRSSLQEQVNQLQMQHPNSLLEYDLQGQDPLPSSMHILQKLAVVERFAGFHYIGPQAQASYQDAQAGEQYHIQLDQHSITQISLAYQQLKTDLYESLLPQSRLAPFYQLWETTLRAERFDIQAFESQLGNLIQGPDGMLNLIEFISGYGPARLQALGWDSIGFLGRNYPTTPLLSGQLTQLAAWDLHLDGRHPELPSTMPRNMLMSGISQQNNQLEGRSGDDVLIGAGLADTLTGGTGHDYLIGRAGNDLLLGQEGNDTLDGGQGDDFYEGGMGHNTYLFGAGSGHDRLMPTQAHEYQEGQNNVLQLAAGITAANLKLTRNGNDLLIELPQDSFLVHEFFLTPNGLPYHNPLQQIRFADGNIWDEVKIRQQTSSSNTTPDLLQGSANADTLYGYGGADTLYGADGDDYLYGGADNDQLFGDKGNDFLLGGSGNDLLNGGEGHNTYFYNRNDGADTITPIQSGATGRVNTLEFGAEIDPAQLNMRRDGPNLKITFQANSSDSLLVQNFFYQDSTNHYSNPLQQIKFANGTALNLAAIRKAAFYGSANADTLLGSIEADVMHGNDGHDNLQGNAGDDLLYGGNGNDYLSGGSGNDSLYGGTGNDNLHGGSGNNRYFFARGDGQDTIASYTDSAPGKLNTLHFSGNIAPAEINLQRVGSGSNLEIQLGNDRLTVQNFFSNDNPQNSSNPLQQISFADGSTLNISAILQRIFQGNAQHESLYGTSSGDSIYGQDGNDRLHGRSGNDSLQGGSGNDYLYGESGNDLLEGGSGDDVLVGGIGNNRYLFGLGDGKDSIPAYQDATSGKLNTLEFKAGIQAEQIQLSRNLEDLHITLNAQDSITVLGFYKDNNSQNSSNPVQQFRFADGQIWDLTEISEQLTSHMQNNEVGINTVGVNTAMFW